MSHRMVTGSRDAAPVPLTHGRFGYGVPKAKRNSIALDEVEDNIADYFPAAASSSVLEEGAASHPQPAAALPSALSADHSPVGDEDSAVEPASSVEHEIDDPGGAAVGLMITSPVAGPSILLSMNWTTPAVGTDNDPGGGSITSADADSALIVSNASKTSSSPLLSSFATGLTSSRDSSSIVAKELVSDDSDDEDVEYKGHFCSGCSIPPPGGVRGWVRGYGGVGLWEAGPGCACCEDYD